MELVISETGEAGPGKSREMVCLEPGGLKNNEKRASP